MLPAGPHGTAAAAEPEPEPGWGGRDGSGAEPGAVSGAGGRGFLGARRCCGSGPLPEGFVICFFSFKGGQHLAWVLFYWLWGFFGVLFLGLFFSLFRSLAGPCRWC